MEAGTVFERDVRISPTMEKENICWHDVDQPPFRIYGVQKENGKYRRMAEESAKGVSELVYRLHTNTAGGRIRFVTDSAYVAIHAEMDGISRLSHFAFTGSAGMDLYAVEDGVDRYIRTIIPPMDMQAGFEEVIDLPGRKERLLTVNLPLYSNVNRLYIGLEKQAVVKRAPDYVCEKPFVTYGSSITQGGCASRPGCTYQAFLTRWMDWDHINLGFSGSARGEDEMTEWICNLDMNVFILDYDHNAPSVEHLAATHERMFWAVRAAHPQLPIIIFPRPKFCLDAEEQQRLAVIRATYEHAVETGDQNVFFLDGKELLQGIEADGTVDSGHPNDGGFYCMARALLPVLQKIQQTSMEG